MMPPMLPYFDKQNIIYSDNYKVVRAWMMCPLIIDYKVDIRIVHYVTCYYMEGQLVRNINTKKLYCSF